MPTYEYQCLKCKKKFDYTQSMVDKPITACIYCKGKVERLIGSGSGLIFKGTGFYSTDYKKPTQKTGSDDKKTSGKATPPEKKP